MTAHVKFEDPGDPGVSGTYADIFEACRERPGEWAVLVDNTTSPGGYLTRIREGRYKGIEAGEFEGTTRRRGAGTRIYVRKIATNGATPDA